MTQSNRHLDLETLKRRVDCPHDFACLGDESACETAKYTDRDVDILVCQCTEPCQRRSSIAGMLVCTCPVGRRAHLDA